MQQLITVPGKQICTDNNRSTQYLLLHFQDYSGMDNELLAWRSFSRRRPKSVESKDLSFAMDKAERFKLNKYKGNPFYVAIVKLEI